MGTETKNIVKNISWLTGSEIAGMLMSAMGVFFLARALGDSEFGKYGFVIAFVSLFAVLTEFGFPLLLISDISKDKTLLRKYINNILAIKIIFGISAVGIILLFISFSNKDASIKFLTLLVAANIVISSFTGFFYAIFRAHEKMKFEAVFKTIQNILLFILILFVFFSHLTLTQFVQYTLLITSIHLLLVFIFTRTWFVSFHLDFDLKFWKSLFIGALPLALSSIFVSIYYNLDSVMLSFWKTDEIVGWYNAAYKIIFLLLAFVTIFHSTIYPVLSRLIIQDPEKAKFLLKLSLKLTIVLGMPLMVIISILAAPIIKMLFGVQFLGASAGLSVLIWTLFVSSLGVIYGNTLLAIGMRRRYAFIVGIGAITNVILNFMLIPSFSLVGAATATVAAECIVLFLMYAHFNNKIFPLPFLHYFPKPFFISIIIGSATYYLYSIGVNFFFVLFFDILVYPIALIIVKGVTKDDIILLRSLYVRPTTT